MVEHPTDSVGMPRLADVRYALRRHCGYGLESLGADPAVKDRVGACRTLLQNAFVHHPRSGSLGRLGAMGGRFGLCVEGVVPGDDLRHVITLAGHTGGVQGVAVTGDGRYAVTASDDATAIVWDLATYDQVQVLDGHTGWLCAVAVTGDGRYAITASDDRTAIVWDLATFDQVKVLDGHTGGVLGVAVTGDGRYAITASWDRSAIVWDLATFDRIHTHRFETHLTAIAPVGDHGIIIGFASGRVARANAAIDCF